MIGWRKAASVLRGTNAWRLRANSDNTRFSKIGLTAMTPFLARSPET